MASFTWPSVLVFFAGCQNCVMLGSGGRPPRPPVCQRHKMTLSGLGEKGFPGSVGGHFHNQLISTTSYSVNRAQTKFQT